MTNYRIGKHEDLKPGDLLVYKCTEELPSEYSCWSIMIISVEGHGYYKAIEIRNSKIQVFPLQSHTFMKYVWERL